MYFFHINVETRECLHWERSLCSFTGGGTQAKEPEENPREGLKGSV